MFLHVVQIETLIRGFCLQGILFEGLCLEGIFSWVQKSVVSNYKIIILLCQSLLCQPWEQCKYPAQVEDGFVMMYSHRK